MESDNLKKWGSFVCFVILAGISCWATEQSFHLLIRQMPEVFVWGLTVAFFIVASYGTKLIVDSLNNDIFIEHKQRNFFVGVVLVIIFWLIMSMPTNTHTFFYNHNIGKVVQEDIAITKGYLIQIEKRENVDSAYFAIHDKVSEMFKLVEGEFNGTAGTGSRGNGEYVRGFIGDINPILQAEVNGCEIRYNDEPHAWRSTNQKILSDYIEQMNQALFTIRDKKYTVSQENATIAAKDIVKLNQIQDTIKQMTEESAIHDNVITKADGILLVGYTDIKNNQKFVRFADDTEKERYTAENLETSTKRMLSVIDVWSDFLAGKYPLSFWYYVLLSILVDIAAFIFFDFAFKKENYY